MIQLQDALYKSISAHGKVDIYGLLNLYPHVTKWQLIRGLFSLRNDGYIVIRKTRMIDGVRTNNPNVRLSKKHTFQQQSLF